MRMWTCLNIALLELDIKVLMTSWNDDLMIFEELLLMWRYKCCGDVCYRHSAELSF